MAPLNDRWFEAAKVRPPTATAMAGKKALATFDADFLLIFMKKKLMQGLPVLGLVLCACMAVAQPGRTDTAQVLRPPTPGSPKFAPLGILSFEVELKNLLADRAWVECRFPRMPNVVFRNAGDGSVLEKKMQPDTLRYYLPRIVPGIYGAMNFGQYVQGFEAFDTDGKALPVSRVDTNTWEIRGAKSLALVRYSVDDTWDDFEKNFRQDFYKSAGSMWRRDSVMVLNHNCVLGYFEGMKDMPYKVTYHRPAGFFGATALHRQDGTETSDVFVAPSYRALVDAPVLYARPDTAVFKVANAEVLVAVYAEKPGRYAPNLAAGLRTLLEHQKDYLGGRLPVDRYAFLIYQVDSPRHGDRAGDALEHAQSSLYLFMTEGLGSVSDMVRHIAAHEFFHIVTPLNIHSQRIEDYDFNSPKQSKHLWLYEGMTEYAAMHMPVKQGMESVEDFLNTVEEKIRQSAPFDPTLSLTAMSENALARQDQYYNVYLKGALVGLCLDVHLRNWSGGRYGTQELMRDLAKQLGPGHPFAEDELFDRIANMTDVGLRDFFRRYVEGVEPLPLKEVFEQTGILWNGGKLKVDPKAKDYQVQLRKWWLGQ